MKVLDVFLYLCAMVCFLLAAFVPVPRVNVLAVGLAFWLAVPLIQAANALG